MPFDSRNSNHNFPPTGQVIGFTCQKSTQNLLNKKPKRRDKSRSSNSLAVKFEAEKIELGPSQTTTSMMIPNLMATFAASTSTITAVSSIKVGLGTTQTTTVTATSVDVLVFTPDPTPRSVPRTNVRKSNCDTGYTTSLEVSLPKKGHESMFLVSQRSSKLEHTDGMELLRKALDELSPELANICVESTGYGSESDQSSVLSSLALRETPLDSQSRDGEDDNNSVLSDITVIPYQGRHISSSASSSTSFATQIWSPLSSGKTGPGGRSSTDGGVLLDNEVEIPQFTFNPCDYTDDPDECILISMGILCTYKELQCKISNMRLHWNAKPQEECLRRGKITPRKYKFPASISTPSSRPGVFEISYNSTVNIS
ncbi:hypothetical protein B0J14DRAFT_656239 [Halenospora varia]|nr:hypothetical protein B0J14DRAFT_656239 [Halenospora varia]